MATVLPATGTRALPRRAAVSRWPSPNHGERRGGVRPSLIVIHYTAHGNLRRGAGAAV